MYRHTSWNLAALILWIFSLSSPAATAAADGVMPIDERTIRGFNSNGTESSAKEIHHKLVVNDSGS